MANNDNYIIYLINYYQNSIGRTLFDNSYPISLYLLKKHRTTFSRSVSHKLKSERKMNEFNEIELIFINKLLNKVKYGNLNLFESNQFANSPIGNSILEKIELKFEPQFSEIRKRNSNAGVPEFSFEFDNYVGKSIKERLNEMDKSSFQAISEWSKNEIEKFAKDILGPIKYERTELIKLTDFLNKKAKEKTSG